MPTFHHANLGVRPEDVESQEQFLVDILGYRRVELDERMKAFGVRWFEADDGSQIHLSATPDHRPHERAHTAITYGDALPDVEQRLKEADIAFDAGDRPGFPRIVFCQDPAGNKWELRGIEVTRS